MLLFVFMLLLSGLCFINGERTTVPVKEGETVTLPCNVSSEHLALKVVWRHGEQEEKIVSTYKLSGIYLGNQDKQFQDRVSFFEEEIKKGNMSIQLTNVTQADAGIYTCIVIYDDHTEDNKSFSLDVQKGEKQTDPTGADLETQANNHKNAAIWGVFVVVLVAIIIGCVMYWKRQNLRQVMAGYNDVTQKLDAATI